jgi:putative aldouronate transport system substrate-binding protein
LLDDSDYNPGTKWLFGSTGNAYLLEGSSPDVWDKTVEMNESGIPSPLLGFTFNSEPVNSQIAQCNSVVDEYIAAIDTGSMDIETILPEFQEKLRKAGAQDIIDEMQKQINEWLKTK